MQIVPPEIEYIMSGAPGYVQKGNLILHEQKNNPAWNKNDPSPGK